MENEKLIEEFKKRNNWERNKQEYDWIKVLSTDELKKLKIILDKESSVRNNAIKWEFDPISKIMLVRSNSKDDTHIYAVHKYSGILYSHIAYGITLDYEELVLMSAHFDNFWADVMDEFNKELG